MELTNPELIEAFYHLNKDRFPNMTKDQMQEAVHAPWIALSKVMAEGNLTSFRIKYFGVFSVTPSKVRSEDKKVDDHMKRGIISEERYKRLKTMFKKYFDENKSK